jgi:uncharacterized protein YfaS (alpha-2-macroglobulin family)
MSNRMPPFKHHTTRLAQRVFGLLALLLVVTLACSLPILSEETPIPPSATVEQLGEEGTSITKTAEPPPPPTPTAQTLPPDLIESDPARGSEISLQQQVTLYFNQSMNKDTVEAASGGLQGKFEWSDDATVVFTPAEPLSPSTQVALTFNTSARAANGLLLQEPIALTYRTVGTLNLTQQIPASGADGIDPTSVIVASFNRPVVPLGAETESVLQAFTMEPEADGRWEWINTSTYVFYPEPPLAGGTSYIVSLDPTLTGVGGSPLAGADTWFFTTSPAQLLMVEPENQARSVRLDASVELTFNQPLDAGSVEENLQFLDSGSNDVPGELSWNDDDTVLTFTPSNLFRRDTIYTIKLSEESQTSGGTLLGFEVLSNFHTVPPLRVIASNPLEGGLMETYEDVTVNFSGPIQSQSVLQFIHMIPEPDNLSVFVDDDDHVLRLYGDFQPDTEYVLTLSPNLPDDWSGRLGQEFVLHFRSKPLDPQLLLTQGSDVIYLTPEDPNLHVQVTNLSQLSVSIGSVPLEDFMAMLAPGGYELRQTYQPVELFTSWKDIDLPPNRSEVVEVPLTAEGGELEPGLYILRFDVQGSEIYTGPYLVVVSNVHPTLKMSATEALLWAVDLRDGTPAAAAPVAIYTDAGVLLAEGETDAEGVMQSMIPIRDDYFTPKYAVLGQPGEDGFAMVLSTWSQGLEGWDFGLPVDYTPPRLEAYLYTDRPIYRPGQMVYFRAILRDSYNGRYDLPNQNEVTFTLVDDYGELGIIETFDLPLSEYGSANGALSLPEDMTPGDYRLSVEGAQSSDVYFQVAEYRKPEINLEVAFESDQTLADDGLVATVDARYFFDAPAGNIPIKVAVYKEPSSFYLPGFQVGVEDSHWMRPFPGMVTAPLGELVVEGETKTDSSGRAEIEFSADLEKPRQRYTLEVTAEDESGLPVSSRASVQVNPAAYYIGVRPDMWVGQAGKEIGFDIQVVDWDQKPAGVHTLRANFNQIIWEKVEPTPGFQGEYPSYEPRTTLVGSTDFTTAQDGMARVAFSPPGAGTYQLEVAGLETDGEAALTQVTLWVGGAGQAVWPNLPNQHLRMTADQEAYQPGQTAQVFVPNPFGEGTPALVTIERGTILRHQVLTVDGSGSNLRLPLGDEDAPNIYVSVTLLGKKTDGTPDFRQGYISLPVEPIQQTLNVALVGEPQRAGPGDQVLFDVIVTDAGGNPVEGEFSLSVVDLAVLSLADPNSVDIVTAYYGDQPLGVQTGLALAGHAQRLTYTPGGLGGGGGEVGEAPFVRERFPDTSYWRAPIVTDENGEAHVSVTLPDSLTTWQADLRAVTADTRVGGAEASVITTKDLLVRPVTPRFLVLGDHAMIAAIVQNNTDAPLQVDVSLDVNGFALDDASTVLQKASLPAGGRARVEWWGTVQDVENIDPIFAVNSGELQDAARPDLGPLPVLRYVSPQTFGTSGTMDTDGERLELVSLPRSFDPEGGELQVELSPSLAAAMMNALDALEHYDYECNEQTVSRFLPNLETYRVAQEFGLDSPALQTRLERTLEEGLSKLIASQNLDGGWGWWSGDESDIYITSYVLFGMVRAVDAGVQVDDDAIMSAATYLQAALPTTDMLQETWQFDRLAFMQYVLVSADQILTGEQSGEGLLAGPAALYEERERLNPWSQAYLALTIEALSPKDERAQTLISDLEANAKRSATGAHWENREPGWRNMSTTIHASAVVLYALAQEDPASPLVAEAVRYLIAHRGASGGWASTYETAWTLMALNEVIKDTGELGGDYNYAALLNNTPLASGHAGGDAQLMPVITSVPVSELYPDAPNSVVIERTVGQGRLYYAAHLRVNRPVEDVSPIENGFSLGREYFIAGEPCPEEGCEPVQGAKAGDLVTARLTLVVPETAYYVMVEDYIPAGAEILDISLKTSQQGALGDYDVNQPLSDGWDWMYFREPQVYDDHIAWSVDMLPPGTYELTYMLVVQNPGEYRVLPARAWQFYFPEVQGNSEGEVFEITN